GAEGYVRRHVIVGGQARLELWNAPPLAAAAGDTFRAEAGQVLCPEEHKARHGDLIDYPGFPHMPGDDFAAGYPEEGGTHDGGSLFRS
ncbi:MAG: phage BR0599 family protein, partial [Pseudomonadota bacterium]